MDLHALLGASAAATDASPVPLSLRELADEYELDEDIINMLAGIHVDGRQPGTKEDWLFLLLAIRRSCRIVEPLKSAAAGEKGGKHALRV
jgi:hypothetical protein